MLIITVIRSMANFSGAVRIGDVSDFIAPTQACVVNLDGSKKLPEVCCVYICHHGDVLATLLPEAVIVDVNFS